MPTYRIKGSDQSFDNAQDLYAYQREQGITAPAAEGTWDDFDPVFAGEIGLSEPQWSSIVEQVNAMREGQSGAIPVGPGGSHGTNFALTPESTEQQLFEGTRGLAYKEANPDAYPDPVNSSREFIKNIGRTTALLLGGAAAGGAFAGAGAGAGAPAAAAGDGLAPITVGAQTLPGGMATGAAAGGTMASLPAAIATPAASSAFTGAAAAAPAARGIGSFLRNNRDIIGNVIGGIGEGIAADKEADNNIDLLRERHALTSSNYQGTNPGATFRGLAPGKSGVSPVERFDRYSGWSYQYDPKTGRIVKVPDEAPQALTA